MFFHIHIFVAGSLLSVLWPLLTPVPQRRSSQTATPDGGATEPGAQVSLSKDANSRCTAGPFISGAEHRAALCRASLSVVPACPFRQPYMIFLFVGSSGLT